MSIDFTVGVQGVKNAEIIAWRALNGVEDNNGASAENLLPFMRRAVVTAGHTINQYYGRGVADSDQMYVHIELNRELPPGQEVMSEYSGLCVYAGFKKE